MVEESADLLYHLLVLLRSRGLKLERVLKELEARHTGRAPVAAADPMLRNPSPGPLP